jgi:sigma-B regulation protein RsbU (phosphoserine phosphatase)
MANPFFQMKALWRRLSRKEKLFLIVCLPVLLNQATALIGGVTLPGEGPLNFVFIILVITLGVIYLRRLIRRTLWRLRNRLIITYVFIGVVPIALILAMLGIATYILMGQVASYLVTTELKRRNDLVRDSAHLLAWQVASRGQFPSNQVTANEILIELHRRLPQLQAVVRTPGQLFAVPAGAGVRKFPSWSKPNFEGLVNVGSEYALAAHVQAHEATGRVEVFAYEPANTGVLNQLLPGLASVQFLQLENTDSNRMSGEQGAQVSFRLGNKTDPLNGTSHFEALPKAKGWWDFVVRWGTLFPVWLWESQGDDKVMVVIAVVSRPSFIIKQLFSTLGELASALKWALIAIAGLFLLVEVTSLLFGIGLTRSITRAVSDLYEATRRIKVGDFSHRIPLRSTDQLSELADSFNGMTENIRKLILESKERERLESELEIAREVQSQLFPKNVPSLKTLELKGLCHPARVVSGDYYDFVPIDSNQTALAIGDIAGKGISAALLMASVQSSLRAQLTIGNDSRADKQGGNGAVSPSRLVMSLNRQLYESTPPEKFASFYCGVYDDQSGRLVYTNAGHLPPILIRKGRASRLAVSGMVIGAFPDVPYEQNCIDLELGDLLVAFTDGITEPENEYGEEFGENRLSELLVRNAQKPLDELITSVTTAVGEWSSNPEQRDDMTLLVARRL